MPAATNGWGDEIAQQSLTTLTVDGGVLYYGRRTAMRPTRAICCASISPPARWSGRTPRPMPATTGAARGGRLHRHGRRRGRCEGDRQGRRLGRRCCMCPTPPSLHHGDADEGRTAYIVSRDGVLHKVSIAADGALSESASNSRLRPPRRPR
ncbi:MAG: hypothetical protein ACLT98_13420 [Eggerthellaceae bacterium]